MKVVGSRLQTHQFKGVIEKVEKGKLDPSQIISHRFPMEQVKDAFDLLENKPEEVRKIVLTF